jgi:uncharacterized membrane protein YhiD involved in acid resistance
VNNLGRSLIIKQFNMKFPKTSTMLAAAAITLGLAAGSAGVAYAASNSQIDNPMNNLVSAIATKFNLNQADVQQVFDEQHAQMESQHQQEYKDRLAQAVTDGKLTQEQADKINAKAQELQTQRETNKNDFQNKTETERRAFMKEQMDSLKQWATDNNVPMEYMNPDFGRGHHGGPGRGFGPDENNDNTTNPTSQN